MQGQDFYGAALELPTFLSLISHPCSESKPKNLWLPKATFGDIFLCFVSLEPYKERADVSP